MSVYTQKSRQHSLNRRKAFKRNISKETHLSHLLTTHFLFIQILTRSKKTYSEQILEPSQVYEAQSTLKAHIENMVILFHTVLVYVMHSFNPRGIRLLSVPN
jgi:hypothetical protein